jgi:ssDNA-specific exonuclease RecJ
MVMHDLKIEMFTTRSKTSLKRIKNILRHGKHKLKYSKEDTEASKIIQVKMTNPDGKDEPNNKVSNTQFDAIYVAFSNIEDKLLKTMSNLNKK